MLSLPSPASGTFDGHVRRLSYGKGHQTHQLMNDSSSTDEWLMNNDQYSWIGTTLEGAAKTCLVPASGVKERLSFKAQYSFGDQNSPLRKKPARATYSVYMYSSVVCKWSLHGSRSAKCIHKCIEWFVVNYLSSSNRSFVGSKKNWSNTAILLTRTCKYGVNICCARIFHTLKPWSSCNIEKAPVIQK